MNPSNGQTSVVDSSSARFDMYAVGLSTLCLIHCIALPILVTVLPAVALAAENELVHKVLVVIAVPVSLRVVWKALPGEGNGLFVGAALVGLGLLLLAAFVEAASAYEQPITVVGGTLLASAHLWHWMRRCGRNGAHGLRAEPDEP